MGYAKTDSDAAIPVFCLLSSAVPKLTNMGLGIPARRYQCISGIKEHVACLFSTRREYDEGLRRPLASTKSSHDKDLSLS